MGINLIRIAILIIFVWIGGLKFRNYEAEGIVPFVANIGTLSFIVTTPEVWVPNLGSGYIGLEFASMYASFGSQVTVLEGYSQLMAREDRAVTHWHERSPERPDEHVRYTGTFPPKPSLWSRDGFLHLFY